MTGIGDVLPFLFTNHTNGPPESPDNQRLVIDKEVAERIGLFNNVAEGETMRSLLTLSADTGTSII